MDKVRVFNTRTNNSKDHWETPPYFYDLLNKEFHFTLDPCASHENHKCEKYLTIVENGLEQSWKDHIVFCNPPYDEKDIWMAKAYYEGKQDNTTIAMLIPNGTETQAFQEYCMKAYEIRLVKGRIEFLIDGKKPEKSGNNRGSIIVIFKKHLIKYKRLDTF